MMLEDMEGEVKSMIKVFVAVVVSMTYARFASSKVPPGKHRLLVLFPVLCLLPILPFSFSSVNIRGMSSFFLAWLSLFKLLLLACGHGPLSPSLSLTVFIATASLPVKLKPLTTKSPPLSTNTLRLLLTFASKAFLAATFLFGIYRYKHHAHPILLLALYCGYLYLSLDFALSTAAALAGILGLDLEPQFNNPLHSASLQDFWGRRWNLMVTSVLRPAVYTPIKSQYGPAAGVMATFIVSGVMHEIMFYYNTLAWPTGEVACFFVLHGVLTVAEAWGMRSGWWPRPAVARPLAVGVLAVTLSWLFFPPLLRNKTDERALEEYAALLGMVEDGGQAIVDWLGNWGRPAVR